MRDSNRVGRVAEIFYRGGIKDESVTDDRSTGVPLRVIIGERQVPKGIEDALFEMEVGEERQLEIPCELGYGLRDERRVQWHPRTLVKDGYRLKTGDVITWSNPTDMSKVPVWVVDETQDTICLDFNHPFAGKTLDYWVKLEKLDLD